MSNDLRTEFLAAMGHVACTVNVITTDGTAGRFGVTVSAMSSVSADGPLPTLLVCVHHLSPAAAAITINGHFCVNVLHRDHVHVSEHFSGRVKAEDKFSCATWTHCNSGVPRLADALVAFDCTVTLNQRIGTHHIFFGVVNAVHMGETRQPLIYAARAYGVPTSLSNS